MQGRVERCEMAQVGGVWWEGGEVPLTAEPSVASGDPSGRPTGALNSLQGTLEGALGGKDTLRIMSCRKDLKLLCNILRWLTG